MPALPGSPRRRRCDFCREFVENALGEIETLNEQVAKLLRVGASDLALQRRQVVMKEIVQDADLWICQPELQGGLLRSLEMAIVHRVRR